MSRRLQRANQLIKRELNQILLKEVEIPRDILMTITRVENSPDLRESKVYVSCLPESQVLKVLQILNQKIYDIQQVLNKRLKIRPTPKIKFVEEKETSEAGRIEELLEEIKRNNNR